ncbi:MAG: XRE family transcriptional regulator [Bifidobacterium sp.]|nr:XRE family transcriptional regulator [Bifidobacterium sp.]
MAERYLSLTEVAERLDVTTATVAKLSLPEPDAWTGRTRGWKQDTIDRWNAKRPGHGGRPKAEKRRKA